MDTKGKTKKREPGSVSSLTPKYCSWLLLRFYFLASFWPFFIDTTIQSPHLVLRMVQRVVRSVSRSWTLFNGCKVGSKLVNRDIITTSHRLIHNNNNCINQRGFWISVTDHHSASIVPIKSQSTSFHSLQSHFDMSRSSGSESQSLFRSLSRPFSRSLSRPFSSKQSNKSDEEELIIKIDDFKEDREAKIPARRKLQLLVRDYGSAVFVVHIAISLTSLGSIYTLVSLGLPIESFISPDFLEFFGSKSVESLDTKTVATGGTFVVAYTLHKLIMPVRIGATCLIAPMIVQFARKKGWLKPHAPPPPKA